jgi:hypothetical protein
VLRIYFWHLLCYDMILGQSQEGDIINHQQKESIMAMRDIIYQAIVDGGATRDSLLELTGTTEKGLASQFTYLRMMGKCPMKQDDGTFKIVSAEEWEAHRASSGGAGSTPATPEERVEKARKREQRASTAYTNAEKKAEANPDDQLAQLRLTKADAELQIAEIELGRAEEALRGSQPEEVVNSEDVGEDVEEDLE